MASHHPIRKTVAKPVPVIPDKLYFRIGDVARLCEVPAYVLRFWETEFPNLKPNKGGTGQRLYRQRDVETALRIKHLLYDLGYTIPGARQVFKEDAAPRPAVVLGESATPGEEAVTLRGAGTQRGSAEAKDPHAVRSAATVSSFPATEATGKLSHLAALRDELRALHTQLSGPASAGTPSRPRLVSAKPLPDKTDPRPKLETKSELRIAPTVLPGQQALFPAD